MNVFTWIGVIVVAIWAALIALVVAVTGVKAVRRLFRSRQITREAAAAAESLTDAEVAKWLA